jgi:hypothetical protein
LFRKFFAAAFALALAQITRTTFPVVVVPFLFPLVVVPLPLVVVPFPFPLVVVPDNS